MPVPAVAKPGTIETEFLTQMECKEFTPAHLSMFATLASKVQITLAKEIRDRLGLDAGSMLDFQILEDNTITARPALPDAKRIRGLLKSPHAIPLTIEQMDEAVSKQLRDRQAPAHTGRKSTGQ